MHIEWSAQVVYTFYLVQCHPDGDHIGSKFNNTDKSRTYMNYIPSRTSHGRQAVRRHSLSLHGIKSIINIKSINYSLLTLLRNTNNTLS